MPLARCQAVADTRHKICNYWIWNYIQFETYWNLDKWFKKKIFLNLKNFSSAGKKTGRFLLVRACDSHVPYVLCVRCVDWKPRFKPHTLLTSFLTYSHVKYSVACVLVYSRWLLLFVFWGFVFTSYVSFVYTAYCLLHTQMQVCSFSISEIIEYFCYGGMRQNVGCYLVI